MRDCLPDGLQAHIAYSSRARACARMLALLISMLPLFELAALRATSSCRALVVATASCRSCTADGAGRRRSWLAPLAREEDK